MTIIDLLTFLIIFLLMGPVALFAITRWRARRQREAAYRRSVDASRREVVVDGKRYAVITERLPLVRETKTGRLAVALRRGHEDDPAITSALRVDTEIRPGFQPRWIEVVFLKKDGTFSKQRGWRQTRYFEDAGSFSYDRHKAL